MPRTPARITQADIARVLRAIESVGAKVRVEVLPDGTIRMDPIDSAEVALSDKPEQYRGEIKLW